MKLIFLVNFLLQTMMNTDSFEMKQLSFDRVQQAYASNEKIVLKKLNDLHIDSNFQLFVRIFKEEKIVECWVANHDEKFKLYGTIPICKISGDLGPKRKQGDYQVPEGFYEINIFNPMSRYFLSMGINYPNLSDSILSNAEDKGNDIYIHGDCESIGCVSISDSISELYVLATKAKNKNAENIPVHIFPFKMTDVYFFKHIKTEAYKSNYDFWLNLKEGFVYFEKNKMLPNYFVNSVGKYCFTK